MYKTRKCTKEEIEAINKVPRSFLGHSITGLDKNFKNVIETMSETHARSIAKVVYLRIKQMNGKYMYRFIESR
jgi:hypothetical protein